jgi:cellulose synthase/poly-beta-1,6-N-acetylglucosamine synthase-like glycosyltransferase
MADTVLIWIFWISLALGIYVYFIYPVILWTLAAIFGREVRIEEPASDENLPRVGLLIACYNEEDEIEKKLENAAQLEYPSDRLLVVVLNDGSKDKTADVARKYAESHDRPRIEVLDFDVNRGKSSAISHGVEWLKENHPDVEIIAFSDANARLESDALRVLMLPFSDPKIGSTSGLVRFEIPGDIPSGHMEDMYWKYETMLKRLSSRLGSLPGGIGSIFAVRLEAYHPISEKRGDDFELPVQAIIDGWRAVLIEESRSYEAPSYDFITEYRRKLRITGQMIPSALILWWRAMINGRHLMAFQLFSHKLLRYLVPFYQILLVLTSALLWNVSPFYRVVFLVQVVFYALAVLGYVVERAGTKPPKILHIPLYFTMVNMASFVSIIRAATGQQVRWERNR